MKNLADRASILAARVLAALAVAMLVAAGGALPATAQTYPTNNPTYIPTAVLPAVTCSGPCDVVFNTNGLGGVSFRIAGAGTGIAAVAQGTNERTASPTYTNIASYQGGGSKSINIVTTGLYRVTATGLSAVRLHLTAVTGSVTISAAGVPAPTAIVAEPPRKASYSAGFAGLAPASSPTDILTLTGATGESVRVTGVRCSGTSTASATQTLEAVIRSTANTGGTSAALTAVQHDSNSPAALGTALDYTANPTLGTLVGIVRSDKITTVAAASTSGSAEPVVWDFGTTDAEPIILTGPTQVFAVNAAATSFASGISLNCSITWVEQ